MPDLDPRPTPLETVWAQTTVRAETPSGRVEVTMTGDTDLSVRIDPSWYARASSTELEAELVRAAKLAYVERTRAYYGTWSAVAGKPISPVRRPVNDRQADYLARVEQVTARGVAADGRFALTMIGSSHFGVEVTPGLMRDLDSVSFAAVARQAALECLRDHAEGWQRVHFDVYTRPKMERAGLL